MVDFLQRVNREFFAVRTAVLGDRGAPALEHLVREAGAIDYLDSTRQIADLIDLIRHHAELSRLNVADTDLDLSLEERIQANLPWAN